MRRYTLLVWGSLALSATSLVPVWYSSQASAAGSPAAAEPVKSALQSPVPEDGSGADDLPASSRLVRDVLAAHPNEDLVICIAGCRPGFDRVIYAQPADPRPTKPANVAATPPAATPVATQTPAQPSQPSTDKAAEAKPAEGAEPSTVPAGDAPAAAAEPAPEAPGESHMEPTAAQPEGQSDGDTQSGAETPSEGPSEQPSEGPSEESRGDGQ